MREYLYNSTSQIALHTDVNPKRNAEGERKNEGWIRGERAAPSRAADEG